MQKLSAQSKTVKGKKSFRPPSQWWKPWSYYDKPRKKGLLQIKNTVRGGRSHPVWKSCLRQRRSCWDEVKHVRGESYACGELDNSSRIRPLLRKHCAKRRFNSWYSVLAAVKQWPCLNNRCFTTTLSQCLKILWSTWFLMMPQALCKKSMISLTWSICPWVFQPSISWPRLRWTTGGLAVLSQPVDPMHRKCWNRWNSPDNTSAGFPKKR